MTRKFIAKPWKLHKIGFELFTFETSAAPRAEKKCAPSQWKRRNTGRNCFWWRTVMRRLDMPPRRDLSPTKCWMQCERRLRQTPSLEKSLICRMKGDCNVE